MFKNKLKNLAQTAQKLTNRCAIRQVHTRPIFSYTPPRPPTPVFRYPREGSTLRENWSRISSLWSSGCHSINGKKGQQKLITTSIPAHWSNIQRCLGCRPTGRNWPWWVEPYKHPLCFATAPFPLGNTMAPAPKLFPSCSETDLHIYWA